MLQPAFQRFKRCFEQQIMKSGASQNSQNQMGSFVLQSFKDKHVCCRQERVPNSCTAIKVAANAGDAHHSQTCLRHTTAGVSNAPKQSNPFIGPVDHVKKMVFHHKFGVKKHTQCSHAQLFTAAFWLCGTGENFTRNKDTGPGVMMMCGEKKGETFCLFLFHAQ